MARVEGIPLDAIQDGIDWTWTSVPEYLDRIEGAVAPNIGFLAGHSAIRREVMGERASQDIATTDDIAAMASMLADILEAGALGFSTSTVGVHKDGEGRPVPSRQATSNEMVTMAEVVGRSAGVAIELTSPGAVEGFSPAEVELMAEMSPVSGCPLNWNVLVARANKPEFTDHQLRASYQAERAGGPIHALMLPHTQRLRFTLKSGVILGNLPVWEELLVLPFPERIAALRDRQVRQRLREGASAGTGYVGAIGRSMARMEVADTANSDNAHFVGRALGEIGREQGSSAVDVLIDLALADELEAGFLSAAPDQEDILWAERARVWHDPHVVLGASDAGAHLDMMCGAVYTTQLLGEGVRQRRLLSLEQAVALLSRSPARLYGLRNRGELAEGFAADLVVFDEHTVGPCQAELRYDLPGGSPRVFAGAQGVRHVFVNGVGVIRDGAATSASPGTLLRSGRDAVRP